MHENEKMDGGQVFLASPIRSASTVLEAYTNTL